MYVCTSPTIEGRIVFLSLLTSQPYTPYSYTLGAMLRELHWCLLLAATTETNPLTLTQIIKVGLQWWVCGCGMWREVGDGDDVEGVVKGQD